ncbi:MULTISPECIES: MptD family putative ECF transporter S component [Microbacteriaceae]|uniref:Substrate-specific component BL0695 of predicted ECF transporter n=2 Tax=Mycetocola reblochoni TaxID=331618 RepID=A0A1R4JQW5_9MICO|nr:MptD family putative ECF transporter S component [Mycetocola reblochoni]RLP67763.1 Trep_Strep domain-containing protein [Mycetocola reblochoni]SJN34671.1 Substrate-specific component BL0695 of predicted ECF transporter [Mycetocola reblochoni REB411]
MSDTAPAPATAAPTPPKRSLRFSPRDIINVAIFAVIYFIVVFAVAMLGVISPFVMIVTLPLTPIVAGIPYMLFLTRVRHAGMVALMGVALAALDLVIGHPWQSALIIIVLSLIGEAIMAAGKYRSTWAAIWTYTVFSAWFIGPWVPFLLDPAGYIASYGLEAYGEEYAQSFRELVTVPTILLMVLSTVVCGFLGGLLGSRLLSKHFRKAGLA